MDIIQDLHLLKVETALRIDSYTDERKGIHPGPVTIPGLHTHYSVEKKFFSIKVKISDAVPGLATPPIVAAAVHSQLYQESSGKQDEMIRNS